MASASISVVIPAYNAEDTVSDAIESVFGQTYTVLEVIVVDDGSADGTANLVSSRFPNVRLLRVANGGPSEARNRGIALAKGNWIAFLDADDRWHPAKLEMQMAVVNQEVELVASDWLRGGVFQLVPQSISVTPISYRDLLTMNQFQTSTVLMTRRLAEVLHGFDSAVDGAEDWDFWLRAARETSIIKVNWPLVQYRDVSTGYSKDVWRVYRTMQPMLDKHRGTEVISAHDFAVLETWHHLRFWVAFYLAHDRARARQAWNNAVQRRLVRFVPVAGVKYLVPFLVRRLKRRAR